MTFASIFGVISPFARKHPIYKEQILSESKFPMPGAFECFTSLLNLGIFYIMCFKHFNRKNKDIKRWLNTNDYCHNFFFVDSEPDIVHKWN